MSQINVILPDNTQSPDFPITILRTGHYEKAQDHYIYRTHTTHIPESILIYCYDGEGWLEDENQGNRVAIKKDTVIYCGQNSIHGYGSSKDHPWSLLWVHFTGSFSQHFRSELNTPRNVLTFTPDPSINAFYLFRQIFEQLQFSITPTTVGIANNCLRAMLYHLIAQNTYTNHKQITSTEDDSHIQIFDDPISKSIHYMQNHLDQSLSLDALCHEIQISKYHFVRRFKQVNGYSPMAYFMKLKLEKACFLLTNTALSIKEISEALGFANPYYFSEAFKKNTGFAPSIYRNFVKKQY